jgi:predicted CXXCH cytochrome family protein
MQTTPNPKRRRRLSLRRQGLILALSTAAVAIAVSCVHTVNRVVMSPPQIAGATFVGSESCAECHDDVVKGFAGATHSWLKAHDGTNISCESCHGPASLHVETGGALHTIINPDRNPETCFQCHLDKRGEFRLAHSHPVIEGKVTCSDCHSPHSGDAMMGGGTQLASMNDTCLQCHTAQRGPYTFEHEAMREGCTTCHAPHGSINNKMLVARNANLCLQCHTQPHANDQIIVGGRAAKISDLRTGTCWSQGCHEGVHGSHFNSSLRF